MDLIRGFLGKDINNSVENPNVTVWFQNIPPDYLAFVCAGCTFTLVIILLSILHLIYVLSFISNEQIRTDLYFFVFMAPAISICGAIGMIIPRAALFLYAIALVYFMLCLFVCITLMTTLHGSRSVMCEKLMDRGIRISVRVMPLGCCFFCFPKLAPTEFNFRRIEWLVFQSPLVRIFLEILNIVVFFELKDRNNIFFQISNLIGIISLLIGSYGSYMIIPPGSKLLSAYRFSLMFRIVDFSQLAYSVQKFLFDFMAAIGVFTNGPYLPDTAKAQFFTCFLLILEMLIVSIISTVMFRPSQTIFFDKYNGGQTRVRDVSSTDVSNVVNDMIEGNYNKSASVPRLALSLEEVVIAGGNAAAFRNYDRNLQFSNEGKNNVDMSRKPTMESEDQDAVICSPASSVSATGLSLDARFAQQIQIGANVSFNTASEYTPKYIGEADVATPDAPRQKKIPTITLSTNGNVVMVEASKRSAPVISTENDAM
ncbi:organic solute transporter ostalpha domain-containing protein [Ditylenchus destructor]|uniref:Organic solute transporter ostalpha domain-containing protein n=1 Tax=Ditylenchus destructor TaxID=166010 RepID=A0AAD4RDH4_9BILA|nr:organic solute transporter ostalpha domain-containing protein [Ditylenchus destructor]